VGEEVGKAVVEEGEGWEGWFEGARLACGEDGGCRGRGIGGGGRER